MKNFLLLFCLFLAANLVAQKQKASKYIVYLNDKGNCGYSIDCPLDFLSQRAIDRRQSRQPQIPIQQRDLPVCQHLIDSVCSTGVAFAYASKWLNALLVTGTKEQVAAVEQLSMVDSVEWVHPKDWEVRELEVMDSLATDSIELRIESKEDYGEFWDEIEQITADTLHQRGYKGEGMYIAVFDAGFKNVHEIAAFQHLFTNQQLLTTYNFVNRSSWVFDDDSHGTNVLSLIASYAKGKAIGVAPAADFCLFVTEDDYSEYRVEEFYWLLAAEKADSLGVDVINSSLGYTTFSKSQMNYRWEQLDGQTALVTRAANMAAATGMLVVSAAGNEGDGSWKYISPPADSDSVLVAGAVDLQGYVASFSSVGREDQAIKPSLMAKGLGCSVINPQGKIHNTAGTSFSSPLLCGLVACFWQAHPELNNYEVIELLKASGSRAESPDRFVGYGLPDVGKAEELLKKDQKRN